jgi:simple sugar transport system ATP-binding protein
MALLELRGIAKHFGAIEALNGVDLDLEPGEVLGLMGDNGAGKSTLVKVIAGNFPPSEGEIRLGGRTCHFHKPVDARAEGIEVVYQDLALCDNLTAAANVPADCGLGRRSTSRWGTCAAESACTSGRPKATIMERS